MSPLVSVIIPSYNNAPYLAAALDSVLTQSYAPLEIIVIDDASTDESSDVLANYADKVKIVQLERNNGGPARPRNMAIQLAKGDYVSIFDSDDLMHPEKLARQISFLERHPDIQLSFSDFENLQLDGSTQQFLKSGHPDFARMPKQLLGKDEYRISSSDAFNTLVGDNFVGTSGIVMRRTLLEKVGPFDESLTNSDDIDFLFRFSRQFDLGYLDEVLHKRRMHPGNISSRPAADQAKLIVFGRVYDQRSSLSTEGRYQLDRVLASIYFAVGYQERLHGSRRLAIAYFYKSWCLQKQTLRFLKSVSRALLPI